MNIPGKLLIAVAVSATTLFAQTPAPSTVQGSFGVAGMEPSINLVAPPATHACPVFMRAHHVAGWDLLRTGKSATMPAGPSQSLRLTLTDAVKEDAAPITGAEITVRGTTGKGHSVQAGSLEAGGPKPYEARRTLSLSFKAATAGSVAQELRVSGFTSISAITLNSLTFADGIVWRPVAGISCTVAPDPLMLVAGTR